MKSTKSNLANETAREINEETPAILFFDGDCGFCHRGMRFFMKRDTRRGLRYASLQSPRGQAMLTQANLSRKSFHTLIFLKGSELKLRSDAVLIALHELSFGWSFLAYLLGLFPKKIRDNCYDYIARYRKRLPYFKNACKIPTAAEKQWFIDF